MLLVWAMGCFFLGQENNESLWRRSISRMIMTVSHHGHFQERPKMASIMAAKCDSISYSNIEQFFYIGMLFISRFLSSKADTIANVQIHCKQPFFSKILARKRPKNSSWNNITILQTFIDCCLFNFLN